ncbi:MAG TPA: alkaline phosphatase family protein [Candidatus Sulfotelmatobacter sp.]|nr:alkaline phosphatase family protein [Candidatus Sulfotelmatobacter sp.]
MKLASKLLLFLLGLAAVTVHAQFSGSNFKHVVVIFQENRTPDNLFQGLCAPPYGACAVPPSSSAPYDIQTTNWKTKTGTIQPSPVALAGTYDLGHSHPEFNAMCDIKAGSPRVCRMDGAAGIACIPQTGTTCPANPQFKYVDNSTGILNPYLTLATQYGWANYMFQTNQGPSFPAHQFIFGGTSAPTALDDTLGIFASENGTKSGGCIAPTGTTVPLISPNPAPPPYGVENTQGSGCLEHETMADLVTDWKYYAAGKASLWMAPDAIEHICLPSGGVCTGWGNHVVAPSRVLTDLGNCKFGDLTWITPTAANSDHATSNDGGGPSWVASIVNAIGNSKCTDTVGPQTLTYWQDTAIFITWDDWGGWYDHEPPTILAGVQGDYQYGFRVPMIVVSAYTRRGFVDNGRYDFGSILRFIEHNFSNRGLREGQLGFADSRATSDFSAFFRMNRSPRKFVTITAPKSAAFFINDTRPPEPPDND